MGNDVGFVSCALCGAFVDVVLVVVVVRPTIRGCFIAPDVVGEVLVVESSGAVGAPRWLFSPTFLLVLVLPRFLRP